MTDSVKDMMGTGNERFWAKVDKSGDCWEWRGTTTHGYGYFRQGRRMVRSHRISFELLNGPIPAGMCVMHACDNRRCVNPDHLRLGTHQDNMDDKIAKGRQARNETHPMVKLMDGDVRTIRLCAGLATRSTLAAMFNVSISQIGFIQLGKRRGGLSAWGEPRGIVVDRITG